MNILALVPARGGSKGVPRKNVRDIAGKPLIAWTIEAALAARGLASVVVSTDDEEIAEVARRAGADVPFMRPAELASDETTSFDVVMHAVDRMPSPVDAVLLLQPTSPLREAADIDGVLSLAFETGAPSVVSVVQPDCHPDWMYGMGPGGRLERLGGTSMAGRRQDLPAVFAPNGAIYFSRVSWLADTRAFIGADTIGYEMPSERSVDIDDPIDFQFADLLLSARTTARS